MEALSQFANIVTAFGIMFIAFVVAYIAHLQYRINRERFKSEVFDKRFKVYRALQDWLGGILAHGVQSDIAKTRGLRFLEVKLSAPFLFETDIEDYLTSIWEKVSLLESVTNMQKGARRTKRHSQLVDMELKIKNSLNDELVGLENRFKKYLQLPYLENPLGKITKRLLKEYEKKLKK